MTHHLHDAASLSGLASRSDAGRWLHRLLTQLVQQAARDIHKVPRWEEQGIHSLRKRMKKLQAMLRLVKNVVPISTMKGVQQDVRALKNLLSGQRDLLVLTNLAHKLDSALTAPVPEPGQTAGKLRKAVALSEQLIIDIGLLNLSRLTWKKVADSYTKSYRASRKAWHLAEKNPTTENLHEWRKKVKRLYYQSTALEPWLHHPKRLRQTRKLGSLLGDYHDLDVFKEAVQAGRVRPATGWKRKVKVKGRQLSSRIKHRAGKVFSRTPRKIKGDSHHALRQLSPMS